MLLLQAVVCVTLALGPGTRWVQAQTAPEPPDGSASPTEEQPAGRARDNFVASFLPSVVEYNPIYTFTALEAQVYTAIYEGLIGYHPQTLEPAPATAVSWTISADRLTYRFAIRENARYWNGDPVLAAHFRDAWIALLDPAKDAAYSFLFDVIRGATDFRQGITTDPNSVGIRAVSDRVLEVVLGAPATHFLQVLAHHSFVPIHPSLLAVRDWSHDVEILGNGPYRLVSHSATEVHLERSDRYWDAANVAIRTIRLRFEDDPVAVTQAFNEGRIQWVSSGMSFSNIENPFSLVINPLFATSYYFFAQRDPALADARVRRALVLQLPLTQLRDPEIHFIPAQTLVPEIPYYPVVEGLRETNQATARELLVEAGFPEGRGLPAIRINVPRAQEPLRVATLMQRAWEQLGVTVAIQPLGFDEYYNSLRRTDYEVGSLTWIGDYADPLSFLQMWTSRSNLNDADYASDEYDALIARSMTLTGSARFDALAAAEQLLLNEGVVIPISHSPAVNLIDITTIDGWYANPLDIHPFKHLRYSEFRIPPGVVRDFDENRHLTYSSRHE